LKKSILLIAILNLLFYSNSFAKDKDKSQEKEQKFKCDGRQYCSQMTSCEEAIFFIKNCPNTKMDGDNDGKPCERRCGH